MLTQEIKEKSSQINIDNLTDELRWEYNNLIIKRFPELLEDYLSISDNYKSKLKTSDGKTAENLLQEGLEDLNNKVNNMLESQQNQKLFDLEVKTRYIKNKSI